MNKYKRPVLIAELGVNFNGDFDLLLEMADRAFENGADMVKLQIRTPKVCVPREQWAVPRKWFDGEEITYIEYKNRMELTFDQLTTLDAYIKVHHGENKLFASVWDREAVDRIAPFDFSITKIPSAKITDLELVEYASRHTSQLMISTGMSTEQEIDKAAKSCMSKMLIVLSCNSSYPSKDNEVDLNRIHSLQSAWLKNYYGETEYGFSSHSTSPYPAIYSVFAGAKFIEVHFTLDRAMQGTDQAASLEPAGLNLISRELDRIEQLFGDGEIRVYESEMAAMKKLRG